MIREIKAENRLADLIKDHREQGCVNHVESIFSVPNEKLKPLHEKKEKKAPAHENPHLQTTTSKIFKVLAKP